MNRPTWLQESCPAWCTGDHHQGDMVDDREHQSSSVEVPGVEQVTSVVGSLVERHQEAIALDIVLHQHVGEGEEWVFVGVDDRWFDLSRETAERLSASLCSVLRRP